MLISSFFSQAVDEPGFSVAYARMCEVLQKKQVQKIFTNNIENCLLIAPFSGVFIART
jgi:hypothetical protein